jgi:hypothetical protein
MQRENSIEMSNCVGGIKIRVSLRTTVKMEMEFLVTVVPPYVLIHYPRFQLSAVYRGPKKI